MRAYAGERVTMIELSAIFTPVRLWRSVFEVSLEFEVVALLLFLGFAGGCGLFFNSVLQRISAIEKKIEESSGKISNLGHNPNMLEELKDAMHDIVSDTLENMQPPTAFDHLAGGVMQLIQMKLMKGMDMMPPQILENESSV